MFAEAYFAIRSQALREKVCDILCLIQNLHTPVCSRCAANTGYSRLEYF